MYHHHALILPTICFESAWSAQARILDASKAFQKNLPFKLILQTHLSVRFDQKKHLKRAMQKKQEKAGKKRGMVAYQIQLKQKNEKLHGPLHLKSAIEQHAGTLSLVVTKPPDADLLKFLRTF